MNFPSKSQLDIENFFLNGLPIELWPDIIARKSYFNLLESHKKTISDLWPDATCDKMTASQRYLKLLACIISSTMNNSAFIKNHAEKLVLVLPAIFSFGNGTSAYDSNEDAIDKKRLSKFSTFDTWFEQIFDPKLRLFDQKMLIKDLAKQSSLLKSYNAYIAWLSQRLSRARSQQLDFPEKYEKASDWDAELTEQLLYYLDRFFIEYRHLAESAMVNTNRLKKPSDRQSRMSKLASTLTFHESHLPAFSAFAITGLIRYVTERKSVNLQHILLPIEWRIPFSPSMLYNELLYKSGLLLAKELRDWLAVEAREYYRPALLPKKYYYYPDESESEDNPIEPTPSKTDTNMADEIDEEIDTLELRFLLPICNIRKIASTIGVAYELDESTFKSLYQELPNLLYSSTFYAKKATSLFGDRISEVIAKYRKLVVPKTYNLMSSASQESGINDLKPNSFDAILRPIAQNLANVKELNISAPPELKQTPEKEIANYYYDLMKSAFYACDPTEFLYALSSNIPIFKGSDPVLKYYRDLGKSLKKQLTKCYPEKTIIQKRFNIPSHNYKFIQSVQHELNVQQMRELITPEFIVRFINEIAVLSEGDIDKFKTQLLSILPEASPPYKYLNKLSSQNKEDIIRIVAFYLSLHEQVMRYARQFCISVLWKATLRVYFSESQFPQDLDRSQHSDNVASQEKPSSK